MTLRTSWRWRERCLREECVLGCLPRFLADSSPTWAASSLPIAHLHTPRRWHQPLLDETYELSILLHQVGADANVSGRAGERSAGSRQPLSEMNQQGRGRATKKHTPRAS